MSDREREQAWRRGFKGANEDDVVDPGAARPNPGDRQRRAQLEDRQDKVWGTIGRYRDPRSAPRGRRGVPWRSVRVAADRLVAFYAPCQQCALARR